MQIHNVPQGGQEWLDLHIGIPTSSLFKSLLTSDGKQSKSLEPYARQMAADKYAGELLDGFEGNKWTKRGHEFEDSAGAWYELMFENRNVTRVGFITDDAKTMGCSPDFLVDTDGLLEVKCLKAANHVAVIQYYKLNGQIPPGYRMQPQGQQIVTGRSWCDMLFYHPKLPQLLVRQEPDYEIQGKLKVQIDIVNNLRDVLIEVMEAV